VTDELAGHVGVQGVDGRLVRHELERVGLELEPRLPVRTAGGDDAAAAQRG
jgi:hypothetical protein